jgi:hypothetical protein
MPNKVRQTGVVLVVGTSVALAGCALKLEKEEAAAKSQPVLTMIDPASAVVGLLTGTERTKYQVAIGEYNDAIDAKIADIKSTCEL